MIKLLKYYGKKRLYIVGILSIILMLLAIISFKDGYVFESEKVVFKDGQFTNVTSITPQHNPINLFVVCASILAAIIPMFEFSFKMRKVGIDEYYAFPIKREKLYLTKLIVGFLELLIPMTVFFLYTLLDILLSKHLFDLSQYLIFYLLFIPTIFGVYAINSFIYAKCNTIYDGIINVFLIQFVFVFIAYIIFELFFKTNNSSYFFIYSPMTRLAVYYNNLMNKETLTDYILKQNLLTIISGILFFVLGIVSVVLLLFLQKYEKGENSMDISNSWFSYKSIIPIYIVYGLVMCLNTGIEGIILIILVIIAAYIAYAIYRRNFKIKLVDIITIGVCIVLGIILESLFPDRLAIFYNVFEYIKF